MSDIDWRTHQIQQVREKNNININISKNNNNNNDVVKDNINMIDANIKNDQIFSKSDNIKSKSNSNSMKDDQKGVESKSIKKEEQNEESDSHLNCRIIKLAGQSFKIDLFYINSIIDDMINYYSRSKFNFINNTTNDESKLFDPC